jgi:hypothetical protein
MIYGTGLQIPHSVSIRYSGFAIPNSVIILRIAILYFASQKLKQNNRFTWYRIKNPDYLRYGIANPAQQRIANPAQRRLYPLRKSAVKNSSFMRMTWRLREKSLFYLIFFTSVVNNSEIV